MKPIKNSTKIQPLLFFEQFLKLETLLYFEKAFYENQINPSFKAYKDLGYIEYTKDLYEDGEEFVPVKLEFKDVFEKRLKGEYNLSLKLIKERKEEIENIERTSIIYINQQISKLDLLINSLKFKFSNMSIVLNILNDLRNDLLSFLKQKPQPNITNIKISGKTFFDLKNEFKLKHLKKLFEVTVELNIIDDDLTTLEEFLNVLTKQNLPTSESKITFKSNNRVSVYYLQTIAIFFNDFKPSRISRSQSFIKKSGKTLNDNQINNILSFFKNNDDSQYLHIKNEILKLLPA